MKNGIKATILLLVVPILLSSCALFGSLFATELTIENASFSYELDFVQWDGIDFGPSLVYDYTLGYNVDGFSIRESQTKDVDPAGDYVRFAYTSIDAIFFTAEYVDVDRFKSEFVEIDEYTSVLSSSLGSQPMQLKEAISILKARALSANLAKADATR